MGRKKGSSAPKTPFEKLVAKLKEVDPYFVESIYSSKDEDLNSKFGSLAKQMTEIENARDNDDDLKAKKEELKVLNETYTEPLKAIKMKRKFIYKVLEERGKVP
jgi:hypothetical protein